MFVFWFFKEATAEAPKLIFMQNTSKDAVPFKDVPFGVLKIKNG